jgi:hypothetical protein
VHFYRLLISYLSDTCNIHSDKPQIFAKVFIPHASTIHNYSLQISLKNYDERFHKCTKKILPSDKLLISILYLLLLMVSSSPPPPPSSSSSFFLFFSLIFPYADEIIKMNDFAEKKESQMKVRVFIYKCKIKI